MRCPSCSTGNPTGAATCSGCGEKLGKRARRRGTAEPARLLVQPVPNNPPAVAAYRYAIYGLVPIVGLVLGAVALGFGIIGYHRARTHPEINGCGHAMTGIVLGGLELLTNGIGLAFIATGLRSLAG